MRSLASISELSPVQAREIKSTVLRTLDRAEHFGGATAVEVHLALMRLEKRLELTIGIACTLDILEAMLARGSVLKFEGGTVTTWKVKSEGG